MAIGFCRCLRKLSHPLSPKQMCSYFGFRCCAILRELLYAAKSLGRSRSARRRIFFTVFWCANFIRNSESTKCETDCLVRISLLSPNIYVSELGTAQVRVDSMANDTKNDTKKKAENKSQVTQVISPSAVLRVCFNSAIALVHTHTPTSHKHSKLTLLPSRPLVRRTQMPCRTYQTVSPIRLTLCINS